MLLELLDALLILGPVDQGHQVNARLGRRSLYTLTVRVGDYTIFAGSLYGRVIESCHIC